MVRSFDQFPTISTHHSEEVVVRTWWLWYYPTPSEGWRNSTETLHQRLAASTWCCGPRPSYERWAEMARQL